MRDSSTAAVFSILFCCFSKHRKKTFFFNFTFGVSCGAWSVPSDPPIHPLLSLSFPLLLLCCLFVCDCRCRCRVELVNLSSVAHRLSPSRTAHATRNNTTTGRQQQTNTTTYRITTTMRWMMISYSMCLVDLFRSLVVS